MKHESTAQFKSSQEPCGALTMLDAIAEAKSAVEKMTSLGIDSVARCERTADGVWVVGVDVIESIARMGDNDLLATYEVQIGTASELLTFNRIRRYHREDRDQQ